MGEYSSLGLLVGKPTSGLPRAELLLCEECSEEDNFQTGSLRDCEIWAAGALVQRLWPADSRLPRPAGVAAQCTCESNHQLFLQRNYFKSVAQ